MKKSIITYCVLLTSIMFGQKITLKDHKKDEKDSAKNQVSILLDKNNRNVSNSSLTKKGVKPPLPNEKISVQNPIPKDFDITRKSNQFNNSSQGSTGVEIGIGKNNSGLKLKTDNSYLNTSELNQNLKQLNKNQQSIIQSPIQSSNISNFYDQNRPLKYK